MNNQHIPSNLGQDLINNAAPIIPSKSTEAPDWWSGKTPEQQANYLKAFIYDETAFKAEILKPNNPTWQSLKKDLAKALDWSLSALDQYRKQRSEDQRSGGQGRDIDYPLPDPWPDHEALNTVLNDVEAALTARLYLDDHVAPILTLWAAMTWLHEHLTAAPYLYVTAPQYGSGKTKACETVLDLCKKPEYSATLTTTAVIFRLADIHAPTLLFDNVDTYFLNMNDTANDIQNLLRCAYSRKGAFVKRCVGDHHEPKNFRVWQPVMINGKGKVTKDIMDRCITLTMIKCPKGTILTPDQQWERDAENLSRRLMTAIDKHKAALMKSIDDLMKLKSDRQEENWTVIKGIAALAGGAWPQKIDAAYHDLAYEDDEEKSKEEVLLTDIFDIMTDSNLTDITLPNLKIKLEDHRPDQWLNYHNGQAISTKSIGRLLSNFQVKAKQARNGRDRVKKYTLDQITKAMNKHLPDIYKDRLG